MGTDQLGIELGQARLTTVIEDKHGVDHCVDLAAQEKQKESRKVGKSVVYQTAAGDIQLRTMTAESVGPCADNLETPTALIMIITAGSPYKGSQPQ